MKALYKISFLLPLVLCACSGAVRVEMPNGATVRAELAVTEEQTEKGLMHRSSLKKNTGMLFVFDKEDFRVFWMKNTLISLDIIFLSADKEIACISAFMPPSPEGADERGIARAVCPAAKYVLEVPAGYARDNGLKKGDKLKFEYEKN